MTMISSNINANIGNGKVGRIVQKDTLREEKTSVFQVYMYVSRASNSITFGLPGLYDLMEEAQV